MLRGESRCWDPQLQLQQEMESYPSFCIVSPHPPRRVDLPHANHGVRNSLCLESLPRRPTAMANKLP